MRGRAYELASDVRGRLQAMSQKRARGTAYMVLINSFPLYEGSGKGYLSRVTENRVALDRCLEHLGVDFFSGIGFGGSEDVAERHHASAEAWKLKKQFTEDERITFFLSLVGAPVTDYNRSVVQQMVRSFVDAKKPKPAEVLEILEGERAQFPPPPALSPLQALIAGKRRASVRLAS